MNNSWVELVRKEAPLAERQGRLTGPQLSLIREKEWFRLLIPASIGGKEYALPELLKVIELASWADGSFGWELALCGGAGFFAGFVEESVAKEIFGDKTAITGFYSYGELSPFNKGSQCELHNQTMTITTFSEKLS